MYACRHSGVMCALKCSANFMFSVSFSNKLQWPRGNCLYFRHKVLADLVLDSNVSIREKSMVCVSVELPNTV